MWAGEAEIPLTCTCATKIQQQQHWLLAVGLRYAEGKWRYTLPIPVRKALTTAASHRTPLAGSPPSQA